MLLLFLALFIILSIVLLSFQLSSGPWCNYPSSVKAVHNAPSTIVKMASGAFTDDQLQAISAIVQQAVLPLRQAAPKPAINGINGVAQTNGVNGHSYVAPEDINSAQDRVKFAYWVPNVSGGLVISKIKQRTKYVFSTVLIGMLLIFF
jgi:hypothetical protein